MPKKTFIKKAGVSFLKAPLVQPFRTALGDHRLLENLLFHLELVDGTTGFGEAAIATHITGETVEETQRNLKSIGREFCGEDITSFLKISLKLKEKLSKNKSALAAVEMAMLDALTKFLRIPLWRFFGNKPHRLQSDITIVLANLKETQEAVKKFYQLGFRKFKVKIGRDLDLDFQRVVAVKKLAKRCDLYLDANQGYTAEETLAFLKSLKRVGIYPSLIEQPVAKQDWEGLKKISRETPIPVCADESVQSISDTIKLIREKAAQVINIKLMKTGLFEGRQIALLAKSKGIKLMIGGMLETSLSMTASAHLACGLGCFDFIDLDTPFFIKGDFEKNPYLSSSGSYDLKKVKAGIGIISPYS